MGERQATFVFSLIRQHNVTLMMKRFNGLFKRNGNYGE